MFWFNNCFIAYLLINANKLQKDPFRGQVCQYMTWKCSLVVTNFVAENLYLGMVLRLMGQNSRLVESYFIGGTGDNRMSEML